AALETPRDRQAGRRREAAGVHAGAAQNLFAQRIRQAAARRRQGQEAERQAGDDAEAGRRAADPAGAEGAAADAALTDAWGRGAGTAAARDKRGPRRRAHGRQAARLMLACSDPPMARPSSDAWRTGSGWQQPETLRRTAAGSCKGRRRSGLTEQRDAVSPKSAILNIQRNRGALFASFCPKSSPFCQNSVTGSVTFSGRLNFRHWRLPVPLDFAGDQHRFHRFARMLPIFYAIIINAAQGPSRTACCLHLFERGGVLDSTGIVRAQAAGSGDA